MSNTSFMRSPVEKDLKCHLLTIPVEVRLMIYGYYLGDDGYTFDFESKKLKDSSNKPVDVSLMFTCSTIADEMDGLPFKLNAITFTTGCSETATRKAWIYHMLLLVIHCREIDLVKRAKSCATIQAIDRVIAQFPDFRDTLETLRKMENSENYIEFVHAGYQDFCSHQTPREYELFTRALLDALSLGINFNRVIAKAIDGYRESNDVSQQIYHLGLRPYKGNYEDFRSLLRVPWAIPSDETLVNMINEVRAKEFFESWGTSKSRFSAAAVAIEFLDSLKPRVRKRIQKVIIHEDRNSLCHPACHAEGFIHFCIENPKLRIERRVGIWRNILIEARRPRHSVDPFAVEASLVTECMGPWLIDADRLKSKGMPDGSFSLVLDCDGAPEQSLSLIRDTVHRDVAWEATYEHAHKIFYSKDEGNRPYYPPIQLRGLTKIWKEAIERPEQYVIRFNFDLGTMKQPTVRPPNLRHGPRAMVLQDARDWWKTIVYDNRHIENPPHIFMEILGDEEALNRVSNLHI